MYNKNQFKKINDKKVLHKIKKHWAVISVALLGLTAGGAVATTNASANTTTQADDNADQANHSLNTDQLHNQQPKLVNSNSQTVQINHSTQLTNSDAIHNNHNTQDASNTSNTSNNSQTITKQANQLHSQIISHSLQDSLNNEHKQYQLPRVNNNHITKATKNMVLPSANKSLGSGFDSDSIETGKYYGLNYKYDKTTASLEFTSGTLLWNGNKNHTPFIGNTDHGDGISGYDFATQHVPNGLDLQDIESIKFDSDVDTSRLTNASYMFEGSGIDDLDLSHLNTSHVTNMSHMFDNSSFYKLNFNNLNTNHVTDMSYMFYNSTFNSSFNGSDNTSYINKALLHLDTGHVTNMSHMFDQSTLNYGLNSSLDLSHLDTSHVTNMSYMFHNVAHLNTLDLSHLDTSHVTNMSHMFEFEFDGTRVSDIKGLSHLNTSHVTDMSYMFDGTLISNINLSNWNVSHVLNMSHMFQDADLDGLNLSHLNTNHVTDMSYMFDNAIAPHNLNLSHLDTSRVTNMSHMFDNYCSEAGSEGSYNLDLSHFNTSRVINMAYMFNDDNNLTHLNLSNWNTSNVIDMTHMFYDDSSLSVLSLGSQTHLFNVDTDNYYTGYNFFSHNVNSDGISSTSWIKQGNQPMGTYYASYPVGVYLDDNNSLINTNKYIYVPYVKTSYNMGNLWNKVLHAGIDLKNYFVISKSIDYKGYRVGVFPYVEIHVASYKDIINKNDSTANRYISQVNSYLTNPSISPEYNSLALSNMMNEDSLATSTFGNISNYYINHIYTQSATSNASSDIKSMRSEVSSMSYISSNISTYNSKMLEESSVADLEASALSPKVSDLSTLNASNESPVLYNDIEDLINNYQPIISACMSISNDVENPTSNTASNASEQFSIANSAFSYDNYLISNTNSELSIFNTSIVSNAGNTLRKDYQQEHADENNEYTNITSGMDIYNDAQINYEDELNGSSAPYNLQSLMIQNSTLASENAYDANDYSAKSSAIDSLTDLLNNQSTSANSTFTLTMSPRLLGAVPVGKPYNTNLKADNSTSNVPASYDAKAINSMANEAGYLNSKANVNNIAQQDNISSYNNDIRILNSSANTEYSGYQSNKNVMNSYDSRASSFNNLADSVSNTMNTANVKSLASINSLYQDYFQQASSYKNKATSNDRDMMSFANDIAKNYSSAKSDFRVIQSLAPNITSSSSNSSESNTNKSTKSVSVKDTFISSADTQMKSIANATNSLESTNNNISLVNSYDNTIQNINNSVKKALTSYVSNETDINSNLSAGSSTSVMAQSYEDVVSSINNKAHTPSNVQSANSMSAKATSLMFDDDVYAQNISNERDIKSSLAQLITGDLSSMNADYQNAAQMLNSYEVNSASASASESSASASISTANSISAEAASENQSTSARNSIASQSTNSSASISASQSISASTAAVISNMNRNASMSASTSTSISISASTSASFSASNSISMSISDSASTFASLSQSASVSESISKSVATSTAESTSASLSASTLSTSSLSKSANLSQSTAISMSIANSIAESSLASSAAASVVARGGHWISVNSSVRNDMMSGASEIASYNQITINNTYAVANYLDSLNTTTSELASEKSSAENYVMGFYNNKQAKSSMAMDNEAARDIKTWGEDPDFFTIYQAEPNSIVNNVRTIYEPIASAYAIATGSIADNIKSLYTSQMANSSSLNNSSMSKSNSDKSKSSNSSISESQSISASESASISIADASINNSEIASASISASMSASDSTSASISQSILASNASPYATPGSNTMNSSFSSSAISNNVASYNFANEFSNFTSSSSINSDIIPQSTNSITQINVPIHWLYVNKTCLAHNHMFSVGKTKDYSYVLHKGTVAKIVKAFKVQNHGHSYYRYEVNLNGHNYFVTGNAIFTKNEYIQPEELKSVHKAIIKVPCFMHSSFTYTKSNRVKAVHYGQVVHIKRIFSIGKHDHFMTRFELTNGLIITANRKFVKLI